MDYSRALRTCVDPLPRDWNELPILTASHLAPDRWTRFGTTQHWSGNRLSLSTDRQVLEHARRNGNVQHRTSHTMMMTGEWHQRANVDGAMPVPVCEWRQEEEQRLIPSLASVTASSHTKLLHQLPFRISGWPMANPGSPEKWPLCVHCINLHTLFTYQIMCKREHGKSCTPNHGNSPLMKNFRVFFGGGN